MLLHLGLYYIKDPLLHLGLPHTSRYGSKVFVLGSGPAENPLPVLLSILVFGFRPLIRVGSFVAAVFLFSTAKSFVPQ